MLVSLQKTRPRMPDARSASRVINVHTGEVVGVVERFATDAWMATLANGQVVAGTLPGNLFPTRHAATRGLFRRRYCSGRES